jgi:hypothetical protein
VRPADVRTVEAIEEGPPEKASAPFDPLRYCIFTTIALLAWAVTPPLAVMLMSGLGLWAYTRAWRAGLRRSRCYLRDVRLVVAYLGTAFALGAAFAVLRLVDVLR